ncbi:MAG TPA: asparagine synthase (glutamine-hydrolyzing) [Thermoanaerobaculia bacterium]|nr:asparagine synthase (glutamine-hydrolyzing) [Thermoanaerobaculia bacterium]
MCGIAGILSFDGRPVTPDRLQRMTDAMVHRGPDDAGYFVGDGVGLAMRRLAIIDLATGRQPISNEDGSVQVVLNGEIYNYRELRQDLELRGHRFATHSDTETIVHLYEEHGVDCVERLRGMFAFALWDANAGRLLVARDRLGIKPLYWARHGDSLVFASELKAILQLGELPVRLDWDAVHHLFTFLTTPPAQSILRGVGKLEPGSLLIATRNGSITSRRYWRARFEPEHGRSEDQWVEALRGALDDTVESHMVSDVPVGAFLSGGVDSGAVVASASRASQEPLRTFSIGFRESDFDELEFARLVAGAFGTRHREAVVEPKVIEIVEKLAWHLDEPFGDSSAIPTFIVSELAGRDVKVVLSGDGGDELFAGYDKYLVERRERSNRFLPAPLRSLLTAAGNALPEGATGREMLRHLGRVGGDRYLDAGTLFRSDQQQRLFRPEPLALLSNGDSQAPIRRYLATLDGRGDPDAPRHWLSRLQLLDLETYLPLDILTKVDRMSMAHSIEARVPLLDHRLVELAARIPPELHLKGNRTKHVFKRALKGRLPPAILDRPKRGFAVPLGSWFRGGLGDFTRELLLSETSRQRDIFEHSYIEELLRQHDRGRPLDLQLWTLVSFELWCRQFLDRPVQAPSMRPLDAGADASEPSRDRRRPRLVAGGDSLRRPVYARGGA